ncbi:MAG: hypothetical protein ACE5GX_06255 [Thermoanaerobaculia bacterium]
MCSTIGALALLAGALAPVAEAAIRAREAQTRYRSVLTELASDGIVPALDSLASLEAEAVGEHPGRKRIEGFWKLKLGVIRELLQSQPIEVLIPVIMLHHEAYYYYMERKDGVLAGHARTMATELADIFAEQAQTREASVLAGWVLTSFGAQLQEMRSLRGSTAFYHRAVEWDPSNRLALLNIAINFEKVGEYRPAIESFERLLKTWPDYAAAKLRLANCRIRLLGTFQDEVHKQRREWALRVFQDLSRSNEADWIRSIAYQEWVRDLLEHGRVNDAEAVLREALDSLHQDQQLKVQLISLLDRTRRRSEANALLDSVKNTQYTGDSARQIYDSFPHTGLDQAREKLLVAMSENMTLLATGVGAVAEDLSP